MKYKAIYADPPWSYSDQQKNRPYTYPRMSIAEICALPVQDLADRDCALFLWVTGPMLQEGLDTVAAWGFKFKTIAFSWTKVCKDGSGRPTKGMGHWTRSNVELCLLGTRGKPKRVSRDVAQVVVGRRRNHSAKPDEVRRRIVELLGDVPRVELFARGNLPDGWHGWGNQYTGLATVGLEMNSHETPPMRPHKRRRM